MEGISEVEKKQRSSLKKLAVGLRRRRAMSKYKVGNEKEFDKIAELLKYPENWDTACYDTLASAIYETLYWDNIEIAKRTKGAKQ